MLATAAPTPSPLGAGASGKGKKCGIKRKVAPAKVNKGVKKRSRVNPEDKDDVDFNVMTRMTMMMLLLLIRYESLMFTAFEKICRFVVIFVFVVLPWCTQLTLCFIYMNKLAELLGLYGRTAFVYICELLDIFI